MQKVNISTFYLVARQVYDLRNVEAGETLTTPETVRRIIAMKISALLFINTSLSNLGFPHTLNAVKALSDFLEKNCAPNRKEGSLNPTDTLTENFIKALGDYIDSFEKLFTTEAAAANVFAVTKKGIYDLTSLIESASDALPENVCNRLPADAKENINAAGKCLALDSPTACGFHLVRAVESLMRDYHFKLTSTH